MPALLPDLIDLLTPALVLASRSCALEGLCSDPPLHPNPGKHGQLGHGSRRSESYPSPITALAE